MTPQAHEGAPSETTDEVPIPRPVRAVLDPDTLMWWLLVSAEDRVYAQGMTRETAEFVARAINAYEPAHATPTEAPGGAEPAGEDLYIAVLTFGGPFPPLNVQIGGDGWQVSP